MANQRREDSTRPLRKPARSERLAAALRANLRRRKAQAHGRNASAEAPVPGDKEPAERGPKP